MDIELKLLKYFVTDLSFKNNSGKIINSENIDYKNMKTHFEKRVGKNGSDQVLIALKFSHTADENHPFDLSVEVNGIFELINWESSKETQFIMLENTTSILFPYLRELVSNLTTKSIGKAFILPVMNTYALFNKDNKKQ